MKTIKSQSDTKPPEWDITSSGTTVYHNYNIVESTLNGSTVYNYDVDKMTHQEYNIQLQYQIDKQKEIVDVLILSQLGV